MSEVLNYYRISHYEPYDGSDDIIMGHKSRFTDSELSVMVYDVIDDYVHKYADEDSYDDSVDFKTMIVLAIATSIDALAVGITLAFLQTNITISALTIGIITFAISVLGVKIGNRFGDKFEKKAQFTGGLILILMGVKILLEHLSII